MKSYKVVAQFLKADVKFEEPIKDAVTAAVNHYNSRSLLARNPKRITDYTYSNDDNTLNLVLESQEALPVPSKALRLLSTYLVNIAKIDDEYLSGKQLFKMSSSELSAGTAPVADKEKVVSEDGIDIDKYARLTAYMQALDRADNETLAQLNAIHEQIMTLARRS